MVLLLNRRLANRPHNPSTLPIQPEQGIENLFEQHLITLLSFLKEAAFGLATCCRYLRNKLSARGQVYLQRAQYYAAIR